MTAAIAVMLAASVLPPAVTVITATGAGSAAVPAGRNFYTAEAIAGGNSGFGSVTNAQKAGGGGGQASTSNLKIAVVPGQTVFYNVGGAGQDSWVNYQTNAAPSSATTGCLAKAGTAAASTVAGVGNVAGGIGTIRNGGTGAVGNNAVGGGGAGVTTAAAGQTAGTDTTGLSPGTPMAGATGGASLTAGVAPGAGGGSSATAGTNPAGGAGRVRFTFYAS